MSLSWLPIVLGLSVTALGQGAPAVDDKSPRDWAAMLRSDDPKARGAAYSALLWLGPKAKEVVPSLIAALDDPRSDVQHWAVQLLGGMGPDAAPAAAKLASKLGDRKFLYAPPPAGEWHEAAWTLGAIGPRAVPALIEALGSDSRTARHWAAKTLWQLGPASKDAVPALVRWLEQDGAIKAAAAVEALGAIGPAAVEAIPVLHAAYDALKPDQDDQSVHLALSQIGGPPSPGLIRQLGDADPRRRVEVANLLGDFYGPKATSAVQRLEAALNDPVPLVRVSAAAALARVDPSSPRALSALLVALDSTDLEVLEPAITAVGELGPRAASAVPKLKRIVGRDDLTHQSYEAESLAAAIGAARFAAADALIAVSPRTDDGISTLLLLVSRGGDYAKGEAIDRLGLLGTKAAAAVPALAAIARDAASIHRHGAVKALSRIDPRHAAILPGLIGLLDDPPPRPMEPEEKREIIATLSLMGSRALPAVPSLVRVLKEERDEDVIGTDPAELSARALGRIGPGAKEVIPALVEAMKGEHYVRVAAAKALASMGAEAKPAIPDLITLLKSPRDRPWAAHVLGAIGPEARAAAPILVEALKDQHPSGAAIFGSALLRIDPSQRGVVEDRLAAIEPSWKTRYFRAVLSGALGRRSPEADEYTRETLQSLNRALTEWDKATAGAERMEEYVVEMHLRGLEDRFRSLADLDAGAAEAIPRLKELTHHSDPRIQRLAAATLKRIEKESGP